MSDTISHDGLGERKRPAANENKGLWPNGWCDRGFHVSFQYAEKVQLVQEDVLGYGGSGPVNKTVCKGRAVAWKIKRTTIEGADEEVNTLKKLQHKHLIQLVGSYTHRSMLGLLLFPVAKCDLAAFMRYLDAFKSTETLIKIRQRRDGPEAIHGFEKMGIDITDRRSAVKSAQEWIHQRFLCLASAIAYLHRNEIKHKDIKPSNILLDGDGLWVTDFGSSTDVSQLTRSETSNRTLTTWKYCAPEVQEPGLGPTRRSFDIFSLGCVFLEMFISCIVDETLQTVIDTKLRSTSGSNYRYRENLSNIRQWAAEAMSDAITEASLSTQQPLLWMILQMLDEVPQKRLTADVTVTSLSHIEGLRKSGELSLHRPCCAPDVAKVIHLTSTFNIIPEKNAKPLSTQAAETRRNHASNSSFSDRQQNGSTESTPLPPPKRSDSGNGENYLTSDNETEDDCFGKGGNIPNGEKFGEQESPDLGRPFASHQNPTAPTHLRPSSSPQPRFGAGADRTGHSGHNGRPVTGGQSHAHTGSGRRPDTHEGTSSSGGHHAPDSPESTSYLPRRQHPLNSTNPDEPPPPAYESTPSSTSYHVPRGSNGQGAYGGGNQHLS